MGLRVRDDCRVFVFFRTTVVKLLVSIFLRTWSASVLSKHEEIDCLFKVFSLHGILAWDRALAHKGYKIRFEVGDGTKMRFTPSKFDAVYS